MTIAIVANAVLGFALLTVVLMLLASGIRRSRVDHRHALVALRRQARDRRRVAARPRTSWAARPDAS